jgi:hypothetical protein
VTAQVDLPLLGERRSAINISFQQSNRFEILDQVLFFLIAQSQAEMFVVVIHDIIQRREASVMVEAALVDLRRIPQRAQRRCDIGSFGRAHCLEVVDADLVSCVGIGAWVGE